ncbi:MAG: transcriptional repressor [Treponema sp.]|jgi:Fur family peroxide stress response transcriptional regulator|nr:transcriptional repressor [Treponema sp.]
MIQIDTPIRKHSVKRDAILGVLRGTDTHPGAQWVYERLKPDMPDLSLSTVYRNLRLFREEGEALSLGTVNGEERFDGITEPHPHFVCSKCGAVADIPPDKAEALCRGFEPARGEQPEGAFVIDFRRTVFYGLCKDCRGGSSGGSFREENSAYADFISIQTEKRL